MNRRISYMLASAAFIFIIITHLTSCRCTVAWNQNKFANDYSLMLAEGDSTALWENSSTHIKEGNRRQFYSLVKDAHNKLKAWGKTLEFYSNNSGTATNGEMLQDFVYFAKAPNNPDSLLKVVLTFSSTYPDKLSGMHVTIGRKQTNKADSTQQH